MSKCKNCRLRKESAKAFDIHWHDEMDCPYATCPVPDFPKTNADRIRSMTDEELAFYIVNHPMWSDTDACVAWLKQEVDNG